MGIPEENPSKKRKTNDAVQLKRGKSILIPNEPNSERCSICGQYITEVSLYNGHPNDSVDEYIALTNEKLMLFTGEESDINDLDLRPTHKVITMFHLGAVFITKVF